MKKIFTSVSMALCLMASSFTASAQTVRLSDAQKQEILPAVFEQIKQQTGFDILGLARPELTTGFVQGLLTFDTPSILRADTDPYRVKPDSVLLNTAAIAPDLAGILGERLKITFNNYSSVSLPISSMLGRDITVEMPSVIQIGTLGQVNIESTKTDAQLLGLNVSMNLLGAMKYDLLGLSMEMRENSVLVADVDIKEGMRTLLSDLPAIDYLVEVNVTDGLSTMAFPASLYGIPEAAPATKIPMGDAVLALDFSKSIPVNYINITSYEDARPTDRSKYTFTQKQAGSDLIVEITENEADVAWKDSIYEGTVIITMSDQRPIVLNAQEATMAVVNRIVSELATTGNASWYKMTINYSPDTNANGVRDDGDKVIPMMNIEVTPLISGTEAIAEINVKSYDEGVLASETNINATIDLTGSQKIRLDVIPAGGSAIANAYFTSNIAGIVTNTDEITINAVKVTPVDGGVYIDHDGKATYRIVNMSGATIANGTVSGDNAYIPTSSLAKGVYVIVVTENGINQSVKFVR